MSLVWAVVSQAVFLAFAMAGAWLIAQTTGRSGWIDAIWSFSVGAAGLIGALSTPDPTGFRPLLLAGMAAIWSLRLGLHIAVRSFHVADDPRYRQLRLEWGDSSARKLFGFLQAQAAAGWVLAAALAIAARRPGLAPDLFDLGGAALFVLALAGESLADSQLTRFRAQDGVRSANCEEGFWAWSRHPNYFFEWLSWVSVAVVSVGSSYAYPLGWLAILAPALMYFLLVHVSGIPPLEAHMLRSRGDAFRNYQARVNAFWPGPPRRTRPAESARR